MSDNNVRFTASTTRITDQNDAASLSSSSKSTQIERNSNSINISHRNEKQGVTYFDFGAIPNGSSSDKNLQIQNQTSKNQVYDIKRDPAARPLDNFIDVIFVKSVVEPGKEFLIKIRYSPQIPLTFNVDYFNVFDSDGICMRFAAKGSSRGPCLTTSDKRLDFISWQGAKKFSRKIVEFKNESNMLVQYTFDVDLDQCIFKPDCTSGFIQANSYAYVGITFEPPEYGIYTQDLFCLIHYQMPIVIRLEGICTKTDLKLKWRDLNIVPVPQPYRIKHGFDWYFENDLVGADNTRQVLKIRSWNVDFGSTLVGVEDLPAYFSIHNSSKKDVLVKWCKDPRNIFTITPQSQVIQGGNFGVFEGRFRPTQEDTLYAAEISGHAYWNYVPTDVIDFKNRQKVYMPIDVAVRLMGHTFSEWSHGWIPQYEIRPECVTLPACVPPICSHSTFTITRRGHLPIMFKFMPPPSTRFSVRPEQGLITLENQVIVVQLNPGRHPGEYDEEWIVQFNGKSQHNGRVRFRGSAEHPALVVETCLPNVINFPPTHPDCVGYVDVPVRNLTRHCIRYKFVSMDSLTKVTMEGGEAVIVPNELVIQTWSFVPHETGVREVEVGLEAVVLQDCSYPIGMPIESEIMTIQHSQFAELVGFPRVLEFGPSALEVKKSTTFRLFNFGICAIHYQLTCVQRNIILEDCVDDLDIVDRWNTVPPRGSMDVDITVRPSQRGLQEFAVVYKVRQSVSSSHLIDDPAKEVIRVNYEGILPKMKVIEMKALGRTKVMNKKMVWLSLGLNSFNHALATSMPNSRTPICMVFPQAAITDDPLNIFLYLKNNGELDTEWRLKRKQQCACKHVQKSKGISFREKIFECPHRELFTIREPLSGHLKVGGIHVWELTIKFSMVGENELTYSLELSNNRKILMTARITGLPDDEPTISMVTPSLYLEDVCIGNLQPSFQSLWLYNNSAYDSDFEVNTSQIRSVANGPYNATLLECLNPSGVVRAFAIKPVFFRFDPYQMQNYELVVPIRLGGSNVDLAVYGNGVVMYAPHTKSRLVPLGGTISTPEVPIVLSLDHIVMAKSIPTHSKIERIFFLKNQTAQQYGYDWQELVLKGIVHATVSPVKGTLQPFQTQICKISIESGGHPAVINACFPVQVVNLTEKRNHERSMFIYREAARHLEGEFVFSAQGMTKPVNRTTIIPGPVPCHVTIGVKVHTISPIDIDTKAPLRDQLKHAPGMELDLSGQPKAPCVNAEEAELITDELEKILWDSLSSNWLRETIFTLSTDEHVYYSQFFMSRRKEAHLKEKMTIVPSRRLIKIIINNSMYQVFQEYFGFANVADESDIYEARLDLSKKFGSNEMVKRSELDISMRAASSTKVRGSDLSMRIRIPDAW